MAKPVCVISGVGPGTGTALVRRFAAGDYRIAMLARTAERLAELEGQVPSAKAYVCDVLDQSRRSMLPWIWWSANWGLPLS